MLLLAFLQASCYRAIHKIPVMKKLMLATTLLASILFSDAQIGINSPWTWMHGDNTGYVFQPMPIPGVESATARPDPRVAASTFTDNNGFLWLFGGYSDIAAPHYKLYNDLWRFNPQTNRWTWMKGDGGEVTPISIAPVYGTMGVPDINNKPGFRSHAASWVDNDGNLWLFGGYGYGASSSSGMLNDLWKYNIATNSWTWMRGSNIANTPGNYGIQGVANPLNNPPPRYAAVTWAHDDGFLYLFSGGDYYTDNIYNDIWKYDPVTNNWTWLKGLSNSAGVYGTMGVPDIANMPPSRYFSCGWAESGGSLWLLGGHTNFNFPEFKNDLWRFDPQTLMWTWEKGGSGIAGLSTVGIQGTEAPANTPAAKFGMHAVKDLSGNFWLFGGQDAQTILNNDLWKFNPVTKNWTYMKGGGYVAGSYGSLGVPSVNNRPGSRYAGAMWTDLTGKIWLYGGWGRDSNGNLGELTDLWMINSLALLPASDITLRGTYQENKNVLDWTINDVSDVQHFVVERSSDGSSFEPVHKVDAFLPRINYSQADFTPFKKRYYYRVKVQSRNIEIYSNIISITPTRKRLYVYPNPATAILNIRVEPGSGPLHYSIYDMSGKEISKEKISAPGDHIPVNISSLPAGLYRIKVSYGEEEQWTSFLK